MPLMFSANTLVLYMYTTGDIVIVRIVGPLPHGTEFQHITYMRGASTVDHDKALVSRLSMLQCCSPDSPSSHDSPRAQSSMQSPVSWFPGA